MYIVENNIRIVDVVTVALPDAIDENNFVDTREYNVLDVVYYQDAVENTGWDDTVDVNPVGAGEICIGRLHEVNKTGIYVNVDIYNKPKLSGVILDYFALMTPILDVDGLSTGVMSAHNSIGSYLRKERNTLSDYYDELLLMNAEVNRIVSYDDNVDVEVEV